MSRPIEQRSYTSCCQAAAALQHGRSYATTPRVDCGHDATRNARSCDRESPQATPPKRGRCESRATTPRRKPRHAAAPRIRPCAGCFRRLFERGSKLHRPTATLGAFNSTLKIAQQTTISPRSMTHCSEPASTIRPRRKSVPNVRRRG